MAGGRMKYRHLGRTSSHRQALLRNLVTSLFTHESISTTYPKAKEAQRLAEQLITLGKKNTEASKRRALSIFFTPHGLLPKLFGPLRERYAQRPGGYTRVLRIEPLKADQAPSAILELVDGPKDTRWAMTARTVARFRSERIPLNSITERNVEKVTQFRKGGEEAFEKFVTRVGQLGLGKKIKREDVPFDGMGRRGVGGKRRREKRWGGFI
ncbi:39f4a745-f077-4fcc-bfd3-e09d3200ceed [Sclerotinia trifoliorum]|uniref:Large ribosomal subunit protein bL17m n=1 Tax=Sclerotinia trifoliorum TaxID=28548 RepID=A0A8H2VUU9_9HELO|nr:39f4a745-f077-4fcc-bfd3-e09d3200ceed [Sclerotinia trifoliorum]